MDCLRRSGFPEALASLDISTAIESYFTKETWIYLSLERGLFFDYRDFVHIPLHTLASTITIGSRSHRFYRSEMIFVEFAVKKVISMKNSLTRLKRDRNSPLLSCHQLALITSFPFINTVHSFGKLKP